MSAAERRSLILDAAIEEYGTSGLAGMSIDAVAERAGVSQPYVFRLFGTKKDLIIAAMRRQSGRVIDTFREAAEASDADGRLAAMGMAYVDLLREEPNELRCQVQSWAAAGADPEIAASARECYLEVWRTVTELSGADQAEIREFMAYGMLLAVAAALDLPDLVGDPETIAKEF